MSELEYTEQGWRMTTDTHRHHRDKKWDYRDRGVYHVTLVVAERYPLFGQLEGSIEEPRIALSPFGKKVNRLVRDLPEFYAPKHISLKILAAQMMPDHIHVVIHVLERMDRSVGEVIRSLKSACSSLYKREFYAEPDGNNAAKENAYDAGSGANNAAKENAAKEAIESHQEIKTGVDFARIFTSRQSIWEKTPAGYHERILRGRGQLAHMIRYIHDNPRRLWLKRANPDLFRIRQALHLNGIPCAALGNIFLADYPLREALQCSRRLTQAEIDTRKSECLQAAEQGTVYVSAAISEGEKQICRALRESGYPLVILLAEGFPEPDSPHYRYFKPQGVYFEACAMGKMLLIEPTQEAMESPSVVDHVTAKAGDLPHDSQRYRFLALNALAEQLCKIQ